MMSGEKREEALSRVCADANKYTFAQVTYKNKDKQFGIINARTHAKM